MSRIIFKSPVEFASEEAREATRRTLLEQPIYRSKRTYSELEEPGVSNAAVIRTVIRTSTESQADADARALAAAKALVKGIIAGEIDPQTNRYDYEVGKITEPVYDEVFFVTPEVEQTLVARITINSYGALIINSPQVMFVDVDTGTDPGQNPTSPIVTEVRALELLQDFVNENPAFGFRVYRTFAGLRYLCTSHVADPESDHTKNLMTILAADRSYRALCKVQRCFRARITPKPWRMANTTPPDRKVKDRIENLGAYLEEAEDFATCQLVGQYGQDNNLPMIEEVKEYHDNFTQPESSKPLA